MENRESMTPSERAIAEAQEALQEAVDDNLELAQQVQDRSRPASAEQEEQEKALSEDGAKEVEDDEEN